MEVVAEGHGGFSTLIINPPTAVTPESANAGSVAELVRLLAGR